MSPHPFPDMDSPAGTARWTAQLKSMARSFLAYLQIRSQLFALECREAATVGGRQLAVSFAAGALVLVGYALLLACLVELSSSALGVRWVWPAFVLALLHLAGGSFVWWLAQNRFRKPLFEATLSELEKDQEWISRNLPSRPEKRS